MNKINYLLLTGIVIAFIGLAGCGDDSGPTINPVDAVTDRFSKTWVIDLADATSSVKFGSEDRTADYGNFALTINSNNTYSTVEVDVLDPWPASGGWQFTNEDNITDPNQNTFSITRTDGLVISVTLSQNAEVATLGFNFDPNTHEGERLAQVEGQWTFVLVAQQ